MTPWSVESLSGNMSSSSNIPYQPVYFSPPVRIPYQPIYLPPNTYPPPLSARIAASGNALDQLQSPLFGTLYAELRNLVFTLALTEYDDHSRPYSKHECYYRPGFKFPRKIDTNLLLTCRLIYLETHLAPISLNEHVFCMLRGPDHLVIDHDDYFDKMTFYQRAAVRQVRFFTQLYWLEGRGAQEWAPGLTVPKLVITVRHSDWWYWEDRQDLRISDPDSDWGAWIGSVPGLRELEVEFETIDEKREQLEERVRVALDWEFPLENGATLVHNKEEPVKWSWPGSLHMSPDHLYDDWEDEDEDEEDHEEEDDNEEDDDEEDGEEEETEQETSGEGTEDEPTAADEKSEAKLEAEEAAENTAVGGSSASHLDPAIDLQEKSSLSPEAKLDLKYPMSLTHHVRTFKFIDASRLD